MLVRYLYRDDFGRHGWFECDSDDFRAFWKHWHNHIMWVVVDTQPLKTDQWDKDFWVYSTAAGRWYHSPVRNWFWKYVEDESAVFSLF